MATFLVLLLAVPPIFTAVAILIRIKKVDHKRGFGFYNKAAAIVIYSVVFQIALTLAFVILPKMPPLDCLKAWPLPPECSHYSETNVTAIVLWKFGIVWYWVFIAGPSFFISLQEEGRSKSKKVESTNNA